MSEFLTTREVAELLRVKERKVYDLASRGKIPCSRATGKLLFPKEEVEQWIEQNQSGQSAAGPSEKPAVLLGSHDPLLEWALRESGCGIATFFDGSLDGINRYQNNEGIASVLHVYDNTSKQWNIPYVSEKLSNSNIALMEWAKRDRGFIVSNNCDKALNSIQDIAGLTVVPRQSGAGSQHLLLQLIRDADMDENSFNFADAQRTENDAILPLLQGNADVTLGLASVANQFKLGFFPIIQERVDIIVDRKFWFDPAWQSFMMFCKSDVFVKKMSESEGYDIAGFGKIHFNAK